MANLKEIILHFENYDFETDKIKLNECSTITNLKNFVDSHISILKSNSGNKRFLPYFDRLHKVYLITKI